MQRRPHVYIAECQCIGKNAHKSRGAALSEAKKSKEIGLDAYRCPHCRKWHVGHSSGRALKAMFQR